MIFLARYSFKEWRKDMRSSKISTNAFFLRILNGGIRLFSFFQLTLVKIDDKNIRGKIK